MGALRAAGHRMRSVRTEIHENLLAALRAGTAPAPSQDLRTRSHPRTSPEAGEKGASTRPVDMFFSGDPVQSL